MRPFITVIATLVLLAVTAPALAAEATVIPGDRISGRLGPADSDTLTFAIGAPASLHVKTKLAKELRAVLHLVGPDGKAVVTGPSYVGAGSTKPGLKGVELRRLGTYRLSITQTDGTGEYSVKLALKKPGPRDINLAGAPSAEPPMNIDAAQVVFDPAHTDLGKDNVQDAIEAVVDELEAAEAKVGVSLFEFGERLDDVDATVSSFGTTITGISDDVAATAAAVDDTVAGLTSQVADLDDRVDTFDGGGDLLRVLYVLDETQSPEPELEYVTALNRDVWVVRRHAVATLTFGPGEIDSFVVADVKYDYTPIFTTGSTPANHSLTPWVWAEAGSRYVSAEKDGGYNYASSSYFTDLTGTPTSGVAFARYDYSGRMVYVPTPAQRAAGFTFTVYVALWVYDQPGNSVELDGFALDVHTAVIRGR